MSHLILPQALKEARPRVLCSGGGVALRGVDNDNALRRGRRDVDVVHADACTQQRVKEATEKMTCKVFKTGTTFSLAFSE